MFRRGMLPLSLLALLALGTAGCGKKADEAKTGADKGGDAGVSLPTANKPIDTRYVSDDFVGAVVLHPARALESKFVKDVLAEVEKEFGRKKVAGAFAKVKQEVGVDPRKIEQVIVLIDRESGMQAAAMFQGGGGEEPLPAMIVRFNEAVDQQAILSKIGEKFTAPPKGLKVPRSDGPVFPGKKADAVKPDPPEFSRKPSSAKKETPKKADQPKEPTPGGKDSGPPKSIEKAHDGKTYRVFGPAAVCFVDDKTLLTAKEDLLKKMITASDVKSPLTARLKTLGDEHDLVVAMDAAPLTDLLKNFPPDAFGPEITPAVEHAKKIKTIAITAGISGGTLASVVLQMPGEEDAKGFASYIQEKGVTKLHDLYAQMKSDPKAKVPPEAQFLVKLADEIVEGLKAGHVGSDVVVSIPRPAELDKLPSQLGPAIKAAGKAGKTANIRAAKASIKGLEMTAKLYAVDHNANFPSSIQDLLHPKDIATGKPARPYLERVPRDPWGQELHYEWPIKKTPNAQQPAIWSNGPNMKDEGGSGDDISNWMSR